MNENERADLDRLLPAPARPELSADRHQLLRGHLMREIAEKPVRNRRSRLGWVALPAMAGGLALAVVLSSGGGGTAPQPPSAAAPAPLNAAPVGAVQLLDRVAEVAAAKPVPQAGKGKFVYVDSLVAFSGVNLATGEASVDKPHRRQIWLAVDGSEWGVLIEEGKGLPSGAKGGKQPGEPEPRTDGGIWLGPATKPSLNSPTYQYLAGLPTDAEALIKKIYDETKGMGQTPDQEAFVTIGDLLREQIAPPAVSAALYRAAAKIPGVTTVDDVVDASGRHGVAVAKEEPSGVRTEWIFDAKSYEFLGERLVVTKEGSEFGKPGTVVGQTAVLGRAVVDKAGEASKG
ncbi:CU044_5270 family protein [Kitasatospora sp. NPDC058170]|uniref:CU044_5270 family protein n=1 Tax=Kitasatospora sp. NPDC058170 TaxID=3346364 RepID=UPI0036D7F9EB